MSDPPDDLGPADAFEALRDLVFLENGNTPFPLVPAGVPAVERAQRIKRVLEALDLAAAVIFGYWRDRMGKTIRVILDAKRRARIIARLRENGGDVSELLYAVDGATHDPFLMGNDPNAKRRYDGIETVFRDRAQVERLVELSGWDGHTEHPYLARRD